MHPGVAWLKNDRARLILLLVVLASLVVYLVVGRAGLLGIGSGQAALESCEVGTQPQVVTVPRAQVVELRRDIGRAMSSDSDLLPYELGLIDSGVMWSDIPPGTESRLPAGASLPGGYEMRWRLANGDNGVVDAMVFADPGRAEQLFERASSTHCRAESVAIAAPFPLGGRNLQWRNPVGAAQEDLFLLRGRRVYRVAVVTPLAEWADPAAIRDDAFAEANGLACRLPGAGCGSAWWAWRG